MIATLYLTCACGRCDGEQLGACVALDEPERMSRCVAWVEDELQAEVTSAVVVDVGTMRVAVKRTECLMDVAPAFSH